MEARCLLLVIFAIQGGSSYDKDRPYCTEQRGTIIVEEGASVTIPCNFTFPNQKDGNVEVRVYWRRGRNDRCGDGDIIYNHTEQRTHPNYTGRISLGGKPKEGTADITIRNLKRSDRPMFCCRIQLYEGSEPKVPWQNRHGTFIQFTDEFSVEQADAVPALIGEDITIPCVVNYIDSSLIEEVTWTVGTSDLCVENNDKSAKWTEMNKSQITGRWSVVNFPVDLSLRIMGMRPEDNKQYCCKVKRSLRNEKMISSIRGTEVAIVDTNTQPFQVVQPKMSSSESDGSATISCSYELDTNPLWTEVFWRVGSPRGAYAYHPFMKMVTSSYRGRTELRGQADLHIKGVKNTDNTTYYCFVMKKICAGNNKFRSNIRYGSGTQLEIKDAVPNKQTEDSTLIYAMVAVVLVAIILCAIVLIVILKKKGVLCQKRSRRDDNRHLTSGVALNEQNPSGNVQMSRASSSAPPPLQEDSAGILYAHLNVTALEQKTRSRSQERMPDSDSHVVYAAVKPTVAHQDIYSTVNR